MPSYTTTFTLPKPSVGGDRENWGIHLNTALDKIDLALTNIQTTANGALAKTGGAVTGTITLGEVGAPATPLNLTTTTPGTITLLNALESSITFKEVSDQTLSDIKIFQDGYNLHLSTKPSNPEEDDEADKIYGKLYLNGYEVYDKKNLVMTDYMPKTGGEFTGGITLTDDSSTTILAIKNTKTVDGTGYAGLDFYSGNREVYDWRIFSHNDPANKRLYFYPASGGSFDITMDQAGVLTAIDVAITSDARLKKNIVPITNALERVCQLSGVDFEYIEGSKKSTGLIAQDVLPVFGRAVHTDEKGIMSVSYPLLVGALVESIKELTARIETLEGR